MNAAVYAGTRNLYNKMVVAAKSLSYNSSIDKIYFLIEDPSFPYELPKWVQCIDVSNQKFFNQNGPNVYKLWTWMVLMRAALTKIFPQYSKILSLDVDTIVDESIDELWDIDISSYYIAGAKEPKKTSADKPYINMGVAIFNLDRLRADHIDDTIIYLLNNKKYLFAEQDCINDVCGSMIYTISSMYNSNPYTEECLKPKIYHFACDRNYDSYSLYKKYESMNWQDIRSDS